MPSARNGDKTKGIYSAGIRSIMLGSMPMSLNGAGSMASARYGNAV